MICKRSADMLAEDSDSDHVSDVPVSSSVFKRQRKEDMSQTEVHLDDEEELLANTLNSSAMLTGASTTAAATPITGVDDEDEEAVNHPKEGEYEDTETNEQQDIVMEEPGNRTLFEKNGVRFCLLCLFLFLIILNLAGYSRN